MLLQWKYQDCTAQLIDDTFVIANERISRSFTLRDGGFFAGPIVKQTTGEILGRGTEENLLPIALPEGLANAPVITADGEEYDDLGVAQKGLRCRITLGYASLFVRFTFVIYPKQPLIRQRIAIKGGLPIGAAFLPVCTLDATDVCERHTEWEATILHAVTDRQNNVTRTVSGIGYRQDEQLSANILRIHRTLPNDGVFWVKEAPAAAEQVCYPGADFFLQNESCSLRTAGYLPSDLHGSEYISLYATAFGLYEGGRYGFLQAIRAYHEARHRYNAETDAIVTCNTWGDNSKGANIDLDFVLRELPLAKELGVTHYQIDAGWNTTEINPENGARLWKKDVSFAGDGMTKATRAAESLGLRLGLWFEPNTDMRESYDTWEYDAAILTALWKEHGVRFFKLDGFKIMSYTGNTRFERMLRHVREQSGGEVFFNMDITNWPRTGFLGATQYANIFLENRYTDWGNYYPHLTLRNLWALSAFFPSYRIQTEFLNTARSHEAYAQDDPLRPAAAGQAYSVAVSLFASPLAWMETTNLDQEHLETIRRTLEELPRNVASRLVLPVGDAPNGVNFACFQAVETDHSGWILAIRGAGEASSQVLSLYGAPLAPGSRLEAVAGAQEATFSINGGALEVTLPCPFTYTVLHYAG